MTEQPEMRDRILAPVAVLDSEGNVTGANLGALIRRLILFEQIIIDSYGMRELPALIDALGPEQFVELLASGAVLIRADGWAVGEIGNDPASLRRTTPLPPLSYAIAALVPAAEYRKQHISARLGEIRAMSLDIETSKRVRLAVVDSLVPFPDDAGRPMLAQLPIDLTMRTDIVRAATDWALREYGNRDPEGLEYSIQLHKEEGDDVDVFRAETNIGKRFSLDVEDVDRVLERAVLAVGGLNHRFEEMRSYNAVCGLRESELVLVDARLESVVREVDPERQEARLTRVLELAELPDPETAEGTVNVERLLEAREHRDLVEFRQWLRTLDDATDEEIRERVKSVTERIAEAFHGPQARRCGLQ